MAKSVYIDAEFPISIGQLITTILPQEHTNMFRVNAVTLEKLSSIITDRDTKAAINQKVEQLRKTITMIEAAIPPGGKDWILFDAFKDYPVPLMLYVLAFTNLEQIRETGHTGDALTQERARLKFVFDALTVLRGVIYLIDEDLNTLASYREDNNSYQDAIYKLRAMLCLPAALLSIDKRQTEVMTERNKTTGTVSTGFMKIKLPGMGTVLTLPPSSEAELNNFILRSLDTIDALSDDNTDTVYAWIKSKIIESYENDFALCAKLHFPLLAYMSKHNAYEKNQKKETSINIAINNFTALLSRQENTINLSVPDLKEGAAYFKIKTSDEYINRYLLSLFLMAKNFAYIASSDYIAATHKDEKGKLDRPHFKGVCDRVRFNGINATNMTLKLLVHIELVMLQAFENGFSLDATLASDIESLKTDFLNEAFLHRINDRTPLDVICNRHLLSLFLILNQSDTAEFQVLTLANVKGSLPLYKTQEETITQDGKEKTILTKVDSGQTVNFALPKFNRSVIALLQNVNLWVNLFEYQALNQSLSSLFHKLATDTTFRTMVTTLWGQSPYLLTLQSHLFWDPVESPKSPYKSALYATSIFTYEEGGKKKSRIVAIAETGVVKTIKVKDLQNLVGARSSAEALKRARQDYEQTLASYHESKWALNNTPVNTPSSSTTPSTLGAVVQGIDFTGVSLRKTTTSSTPQTELTATSADVPAHSSGSALGQFNTSTSTSTTTLATTSTSLDSPVSTDKFKAFNEQLEKLITVQQEQDVKIQTAEKIESPETLVDIRAKRDATINELIGQLVATAEKFTVKDRAEQLQLLFAKLIRVKQEQDTLVNNAIKKEQRDLAKNVIRAGHSKVELANIARKNKINERTIALSIASRVLLPFLVDELPTKTLINDTLLPLPLDAINTGIKTAQENIVAAKKQREVTNEEIAQLNNEHKTLAANLIKLENDKKQLIESEALRLGNLITETSDTTNTGYVDKLEDYNANIKRTQDDISNKKQQIDAKTYSINVTITEWTKNYTQLCSLNLHALIHYRRVFFGLLHQDKLAFSQLSTEQKHRGYIDIEAMDEETLLRVTQLAFQKADYDVSQLPKETSEQSSYKGESKEGILRIRDGAARAYTQALLAFGRVRFKQWAGKHASHINPSRELLLYLALEVVKQSGIALDVETYKKAEELTERPMVESVDAVEVLRQKAAETQGQAMAAVQEKATVAKQQELQTKRDLFMRQVSVSAPSVMRQIDNLAESQAAQAISAESPPEQIFAAYIPVLEIVVFNSQPQFELIHTTVLRAIDYCITNMVINNSNDAIKQVKTPFSQASSSSSNHREKERDELITNLGNPALRARAQELLVHFLGAYQIIESANARPALQDPFDLAALPSTSHSNSSSSLTTTNELFSLDDIGQSSSMPYPSSLSAPNLSHSSSVDHSYLLPLSEQPSYPGGIHGQPFDGGSVYEQARQAHYEFPLPTVSPGESYPESYLTNTSDNYYHADSRQHEPLRPFDLPESAFIPAPPAFPQSSSSPAVRLPINLFDNRTSLFNSQSLATTALSASRDIPAQPVFTQQQDSNQSLPKNGPPPPPLPRGDQPAPLARNEQQSTDAPAVQNDHGTSTSSQPVIETLVSLPVPDLLIPQPSVNSSSTQGQSPLSGVFVSPNAPPFVIESVDTRNYGHAPEPPASRSSDIMPSSTATVQNDIPAAPPGPPGPPPPPPPPGPPPVVATNASPARGELLRSLSFANSKDKPVLLNADQRAERDRLREEKATADAKAAAAKKLEASIQSNLANAFPAASPSGPPREIGNALADAITGKRSAHADSDDDTTTNEISKDDPDWGEGEDDNKMKPVTVTTSTSSTAPSASPAVQPLSQNIAGLHQPAASQASTETDGNLLDFGNQ